MSEQQADYITETNEAMQLLHGPTLEIVEPQKVIERRGGKLIESDRPAFVKIYTDFKGELKTIDGDALKVWIFLVLSINRYTKDARPGLRKIAEEVGLAVNTVRAAVERLETEYHLMDVEKEEGKGNIYHPSDYVSVSKFDTPKTETVSKSEGTVSKNSGTVSSSRRESAQLEELEEPEKEAALPPLSEIIEKGKQDFDTFLAFEASKHKAIQEGKGWRGRELIPPNSLIYADWWNGKTGQEMYPAKGKAKINTEWLKAFKTWWENELSLKVLDTIYDVEVKYKEVIGKPSELTTKAIALQALPPVVETKTDDLQNPEAHNQLVLERIQRQIQGVSYAKALPA